MCIYIYRTGQRSLDRYILYKHKMKIQYFKGRSATSYNTIIENFITLCFINRINLKFFSFLLCCGKAKFLKVFSFLGFVYTSAWQTFLAVDFYI